MAAFLDYLKALFPHWLSFMSAVPFLIDRLITWLWPRGRRWLDAVPSATRRAISLGFIMIGVFFAGFLAWNDEHAARINVQQQTMHTATKGIEAAVVERDETDMRDNTHTASLILVIRNISKGEITNLTVKMTKAEGPEGWNEIPTPKTITDAPSRLNPQDYTEMLIARYQYAPPSEHIGYNMGYWADGLVYRFSRDTPCKYAWIITARASLSEELQVKVWVQDDRIHFVTAKPN